MSNFTIVRWQPLLDRAVFPSEDGNWQFDTKEQAEEECMSINEMTKLLDEDSHIKYQVKPVVHAPVSRGSKSTVCEVNGEVHPTEYTCADCHRELHGHISFSL